VTETVGNVSWIEETAKAVGLARNAGDAQKQADLLAESGAELARILSYFQDLQASAAVMSGLNWEGRMPTSDLSRDLEEAIRTLDSRPLNRVQRALDQFGRDVATSLKKHWEAHAAQRLGDVGDLLTLSVTLSGVEGIGELSQELSATLGRLERSRDSLPNSESAELLSKAERLLRQLESSLKPDVVRRFLSAVARGGAPVQSLTADVIEWLADHHSLNRFKIVAGPPVEGSDD
jgi:hypothetical protein